MIRNILAALVVVALLQICGREMSIATADAQTSPDSGAGPSATEMLDRLDSRAPVPLLPMMAQHQKENMRDHLVAVQQVVDEATWQRVTSQEPPPGVH